MASCLQKHNRSKDKLRTVASEAHLPESVLLRESDGCLVALVHLNQIQCYYAICMSIFCRYLPCKDGLRYVEILEGSDSPVVEQWKLDRKIDTYKHSHDIESLSFHTKGLQCRHNIDTSLYVSMLSRSPWKFSSST